MQVKRYVVADMAEAMQQIRADLGPNAVILHTQRVQPRGMAAWFRKPALEVLAAADGAAGPAARQSDSPAAAQPPRARSLAISPAGEPDLRQELTEVKAALATLSCSLQAAGLVDQPTAGGALTQLERVLLASGIAAPWVSEIVDGVASELSQRAQRDDMAVVDAGRRQIRRRVVTAEIFGTAEISQDQPAAICLVGATGVGKTTTLTKLAAGFRARHTVGVITTDTFRVAAATQLLAYCDLLGLPAATAYTPVELTESYAKLAAKGVDLFLVDTPGRNPRSQEQLAELRPFLDAVPNKAVHLVVSCTTAYEEMLQMVRCFSAWPVNGLLLTKADEAGRLGGALNLVLETRIPLTFVATGQRVPEDVFTATPERMADLILPANTVLGESEGS